MKKFFFIIAAFALSILMFNSCIEVQDYESEAPDMEEMYTAPFVNTRATSDDIVGTLWSKATFFHVYVNLPGNDVKCTVYNENLYFANKNNVVYYYSKDDGTRINTGVTLTYVIEDGIIYFSENENISVQDFLEGKEPSEYKSIKEASFGYYTNKYGEVDYERPAIDVGYVMLNPDGSFQKPFEYYSRHKAMAYSYFEPAKYEFAGYEIGFNPTVVPWVTTNN